jgi:hypothetical protein
VRAAREAEAEELRARKREREAVLTKVAKGQLQATQAARRLESNVQKRIKLEQEETLHQEASALPTLALQFLPASAAAPSGLPRPVGQVGLCVNLSFLLCCWRDGMCLYLFSSLLFSNLIILLFFSYLLSNLVFILFLSFLLFSSLLQVAIHAREQQTIHNSYQGQLSAPQLAQLYLRVAAVYPGDALPLARSQQQVLAQQHLWGRTPDLREK